MIPAEFLALYPKYLAFNLSEAELLRLIELASLFVSDCWSEKKYQNAIALLVAHGIEANWLQEIEISGKAASVAAGSAAGSAQEIDNDFATTHYGRMYLELKKTIPAFGLNF
jgi:hypothetical protein